MQIDITEFQYTDPVPIRMLAAYNNYGRRDTQPCQLCKEHPELEGRRIHFHGSELGACPKQVQQKMILGKYTEASNPNFLLDGHLHEAAILEAIDSSEDFKIYAPKNSMELRMQIPVLNDLNLLKKYVTDEELQLTISDSRQKFTIIGHYDGIVSTNLNGVQQDALIECKAVKDYTFNEIKKGNISDVWYGQMQFYMLATNIPITYLIVKNRITSNILLPIRINKDDDYITNRLKVLTNIFRFINEGKEVPKPPNKKHTDSDCRFCPFRGQCYSSTFEFNSSNLKEGSEYYGL